MDTDFQEITQFCQTRIQLSSQKTDRGFFKRIKIFLFYAPEASSIRVIAEPDAGLRDLPLTSIDEVFPSRHVEDNSPPVRVRGTVTYYKPGDSAVLENDGKAIYIQTRGDARIALGDVVDATGFASDREYAPSLRQAALTPTGRKTQIQPRPVTYAEATSGLYSDNLVSITGQLVSEVHGDNSYTVILNANHHPVRATLEQDLPDTHLSLGSTLRIVGVCRILPSGAWRGPVLSHIAMRSASDVQLISKPSWYTVPHLLQLLGALLLIALAISVWAVLLRRRVVHQTAWISRSMLIAEERTRILELISSNRPLDEIMHATCESIERLLPGVACTCELQAQADASAGIKEKPFTPVRKNTLFEVTLRDTEEQPIGSITVSSNNLSELPEDSTEIFAVLSELSTLATRQTLLYQGLVHHSTHDPLTELPNRRLCESRLAFALREAQKQQSRLAVIYIDVNRFKQVNDKYGHKTGDIYLQQIGARLLAQMRSHDMLARVGGDEFVAIAPFADAVDHADALTSRLQACFEDPFHIEGHTIVGSASFGLARYPEDGTTAEQLTRNADHAMYVTKHNDLRASEEVHGIAIVTSDELEVALMRNQFRLAYQPQFSAEGRLTGLEALIRLEDPVLGLLTPDAFISVAERHDVIVPIGAWVLNTALADATRWELEGGESVTMAVNVSVRQLEQPGYAQSVLESLRRHNFPAARLELELVERSLMFSGSHVSDQLQELRLAGVRISLDDFGTGQSSLSLLHKLPIDTIKLDRSFIRAMDDEPNVLPVIRAIVSMAHALGKRVVAEAIEHVGPVPTLLAMGDMDFQGYLLSRPIPSSAVDKVIRTWRSGIIMPEAFRQISRRKQS